ncbi:MAG: hypothetical protein CFH06_01604 [Alphaproteobacteria bacterium MarineAlpha3_Bin5]|nr:hypothetical protein [Magnetovibrio sp.]PPR76850.1 MAG: hypothetical protein CFH06_01604 [Alphaproteobacteria bacterium MarineAlpha3_Bin5]
MRKAFYLLSITIVMCLNFEKANSDQWYKGGSAPFTVRDYAVACSKKSGIWINFCLAYIQGVRDYARDLNDAGYTQLFLTGRGQLFCLPKNIPLAELRNVFLLWANENPKSWNLVGASGIASAFAETWPCKLGK